MILSPTLIVRLRGNDPTGFGHFGADRGTRKHEGTDYETKVGEPIYACVGGKIRIGQVYSDPKPDKPIMKLVEIRNSKYKVKQIYVSSTLKTGDKVVEGELVGYSQDISAYWHNEDSKDMVNHCHVSVWYKGVLIDPETVISLNITQLE
jgi:murein DD-endopeptidase MepM/ murein hydrolase activator NlpD